MKLTIGAVMTKQWKRLRISGEAAKQTALSTMARAAVAGCLLATGLDLLSCQSWKAEEAANSLQIVQTQAISGTPPNCVVSATASTSYQTKGTLDVFLPDNSFPPYLLPLLIMNNMDSVGGTKGTEMNNITLTHFTVTLSAPGMTWSDSCPATFDSDPFTVPLLPGASTGYGVYIIRQQHSICLAAALDPQPSDENPRHILVTAKVKAKGVHGGTTIESAPFTYVVDVCTGCLQDSYSDPALMIYNYNAGYPACAALTANPYPGLACLPPGQDAPILCCGYVDAKGEKRAICPAVPAAKTTSTNTSTATSTSTTIDCTVPGAPCATVDAGP
jgi:hypothetical protein